MLLIAQFIKLIYSTTEICKSWKRNSKSSKVMFHLEAWEGKGRNKDITEKSQTFREWQRTEQKLELFY